MLYTCSRIRTIIYVYVGLIWSNHTFTSMYIIIVYSVYTKTLKNTTNHVFRNVVVSIIVSNTIATLPGV